MCSRKLPAICPECGESIYIWTDRKSKDEDYVRCPYCKVYIRTGEAFGQLEEIQRGYSDMTLFNYLDSDVRSFDIDLISGKDRIISGWYTTNNKIYYSEGVPGIVWFSSARNQEYEVLDYQWNGPRYQDVMIQDNLSTTKTKSKRKGRVAGALIGTVLLPGVGTVIGAAVGTGRKEDTDTRGQTVSHIETQEIPVAATMKLRDISSDELIHISFRCTSEMDARIRNNIASNLELIDTYVIDEPVKFIDVKAEKPETAKETKDTRDVLSQIRELKQLLDEGAISKEEFELLKKKIL